MAVTRFVLSVSDIAGPTRWRWTLTGPDGALTHDVVLDEHHPAHAGFVDLAGHVRAVAGPDASPALEQAVVDDVGRYIALAVLGPIAEVLAAAAPTVVQLELPIEAAELADRPFELAAVDGRPLARHGVSIVTCVGASAERRREPIGDRVGVLAVFSLPDAAAVLDLRRERYQLWRLLHDVGEEHGRAVELHVLQYGATRRALRELVEQDRWDIVHFSGHGLASGVLLETEDGGQDLVPPDDLADLLTCARSRLRLVTLASCSSADVAERGLRHLGLDPKVDIGNRTVVDVDAAPSLPSLAVTLAERLQCACVAMRYPVADEFAIELTSGLYRRLLAPQPIALPRALQLAADRAAPTPPAVGAPAHSLVTPALFGRSAATLTIDAPPGTRPADFRLAGFPDEPNVFVGRVAELTRASAALAPGSGRSGVAVVGPPAMGKTTALAELAHQGTRHFRTALWWDVPEHGDVPGPGPFLDALDDVLDAEERATLSGCERFGERHVDCLTELFRQRRVLVVLDNADRLLDEHGAWRDPHWAAVIRTMAEHQGRGRLVLASRVRPVGLPPAVEVVDLPGLTNAERLLLVRQLRRLRAVFDTTGPGSGATAQWRGPTDPATALIGALEVSAGHPGVLRLLDGRAATAATLAHALRQLDGQPTAPTPDNLTGALTTQAAATLTPAATRALHLLAALPPGQRTLARLQDLAARTPAPAGLPATFDVAAAVTALIDAGLVEEPPTGRAGRDERLTVARTVADTGRAMAGAALVAAVATALAAGRTPPSGPTGPTDPTGPSGPPHAEAPAASSGGSGRRASRMGQKGVAAAAGTVGLTVGIAVGSIACGGLSALVRPGDDGPDTVPVVATSPTTADDTTTTAGPDDPSTTAPDGVTTSQDRTTVTTPPGRTTTAPPTTTTTRPTTTTETKPTTTTTTTTTTRRPPVIR